MKFYIIISIIFIFTGPSYAADITESQAIHCILGEARGEYRSVGYDAFLSIAEAIRNRGTVSGVYGCNADLSAEQAYIKAKGLDKEAARAWKESKASNLVKGASHWESTDFKVPYWAKNMKVVAHIGKHKFYK